MVAKKHSLFRVSILAFLIAVGLNIVIQDAHAKTASREKVKHLIDQKYDILKRNMEKKHTSAQLQLSHEMAAQGASESLRYKRMASLKIKQQLELSWLNQEKNEELCSRINVGCKKLPVRDLAMSQDVIPDFAQDSGFVYEP